MTGDEHGLTPTSTVFIGVRLDAVPVLVVGGGRVATRRGVRLAGAGAHLTIVAPQITDDLAAVAAVWHERRYRSGDAEGMALVVTATGDPGVDDQVVAECRQAGIWVNHAGDGDEGTVVFPAVAGEGPVALAVTTGGQSPSLARWVASDLGADLVPVVAEAAVLMGRLRHELAEQGRATGHPGWDAALEDGLIDLVRRGDLDGAERLLRRHLSLEG